jgi:hypothetical protein
MDHAFNFFSDFSFDFLVEPVAANLFHAFSTTEMAHVGGAPEDFAGGGNFEAFSDDFSSFWFNHFFGLT